jgi:Zn-dependent metalloprotease
MKVHAVALVLVSLIAVKASIAPPSLDDNDGGAQCVGLHLDVNRIVDVTKKDLNTATQSLGEGRSYGVNTIMPVTKFGSTSECMLKRHRLQETKEGVPIFGADVIVTVEDCTPADQMVAGNYEQVALAGVDFSDISSLAGKSYAFIDVQSGYEPKFSIFEATEALSQHFATPTEKIGALQLTIFPSFEYGDILSYRGEVWVSKDGEVELYDVFVNANTLEPVQVCSKINKQRFLRRRILRKETSEERNLQTSKMCGSCSDQTAVVWSEKEAPCPVNTLYLDNTNKAATCLMGVNANGKDVLGPGSVAHLHYEGTYDCLSLDSKCSAFELPTDCADALSDVHFGVTKTLEFFQEYLGVMGGLRVDAATPLPTNAFVHFGKDYCNAFFTTQTNALYFGDCDCEFWSPLTSIDVAAHELAHGKHCAFECLKL